MASLKAPPQAVATPAAAAPAPEDGYFVTAEALQCAICYELLSDPVRTPCGHVFCRHCPSS